MHILLSPSPSALHPALTEDTVAEWLAGYTSRRPNRQIYPSIQNRQTQTETQKEAPEKVGGPGEDAMHCTAHYR